MKAIRVVRAVISELVSLIVDDLLTFLGALGALVLTYALAHQAKVGRAADGFVLFVVMWSALLVSMRREAQARRGAKTVPTARTDGEPTMSSSSR